MQVCACGCTKIENRDLVLCASCNKARRKALEPIAEKQRQPIAAISSKRTEALKDRRVAYQQVKLTSTWCAGCGATRCLTPSHTLTQKQFPGHVANPENIVVLCQRCHEIWEHNKTMFRELCPEAWETKMQIMQELEPAYYERFKTKHQL